MKKSVRIALMALTLSGVGTACALSGAGAVPAYADDMEASVSSEISTSSEETTSEAAESSSAASDSEIDPAEQAYSERLKDLEDKIAYVKDWANNKWDTYVAPFLGGVSLAVVLSFIGTIVMNYVKGKGIDKKMLEANEKLNSYIESSKTALDEKLATAEEKMALASETLSKVSGILSTMTEIKDTVEKGEKLNQETKEKLESQITALEKSLYEMTDEVSSLDDVKKAMATLSQIISKLAQCSDEAVKSGSASEIAKLAELTKEL